MRNATNRNGMRVAAWSIAMGALALACAVEAPPPGGPVDDVAPEVVATVPAPDSAGVDPTSSIAITFSEDMARAGIERLLTLSPPIEIGKVSWKDRTVIVEPREPLHPDTTYIATLRAGFRDYHKVSSQEGHEWAFATAAAVDSGSIAGTVFFRRKPTGKGLVRCFLLPVDSAFVPEAFPPNREGQTDENGEYELRYLPTDGARFIVWAFQDANDNSVFTPGEEFGATYPDTVVLTAGAPYAASVNIFIVDPTEPAELAGYVVNRSGLDTLPVSVALYADSAGPPAYYVSCDSTGAFDLKNVLMGRYVLRAFVDVTPDSVCGVYPCPGDSSEACAEPCVVYPDTLVVEPGDQVSLDSLFLEPPGAGGAATP